MAEKVKKDGFFKKVGKYFKSLWLEMKKVSWPTWKQILVSTMSVIVVCVIFACIIGLLDLIIGNLLFGQLLGLR